MAKQGSENSSPSETFRERLDGLVSGFRRNLTYLKGAETNEAVVRREYIDPFWDSLGWDIENRAHRSPAEKDVMVEAPFGEGAEIQRLRRPDYLFRISGFPRFVVEAKKPDADLRADRNAIFQAKTYAWNAQIPFALLTDFEEFRLFDATIKPYFDEPERGVVGEFDLRYEDYPTRSEALYETFSREAVAEGSLEHLLGRIKKVRAGQRIRGIDRMLIEMRGSVPVDRDFLDHLSQYRLRFAREIYAGNRAAFPDAGTHHGAARLAEAVQRILDRLVFMRACEDRDIAAYGGLKDTVNRASRERLELYHLLVNQFQGLDVNYNGYLFKPHFSEQLAVPGQLLSDFISSLYLTGDPSRSGGPYRFDAIADDILGIIYERFLGSEITVNKSEVLAEPKIESRHAGGVYYTPRFVVDTIVRRVVGPKIESLSPLEVLNVKILDPSCGSGSFLIRAFQFVHDHCIRRITANPEEGLLTLPSSGKSKKGRKQQPIAFKDSDDTWHLAPDFRAALLTSCIHGVDIDQQAVEVTIMSLYLKMLEEKLPPHWQSDWLERQLLPPLDNNIRCGNSLISPDDFRRWWEDEHKTLFGMDEETNFRVNAFDWRSVTHGFGRVMDARGGFDCIIGNPPYIRVQELNRWRPEECEFYKHRYRSAKKGNYDIYVVFIERCLELLAKDGLLGFICPNKFWQMQYGEPIREILAIGKHLNSVIDFGAEQVFSGCTTYTAIHVLSKSPYREKIDYCKITELIDGESQCDAIVRGETINDAVRFCAANPEKSLPWTFVDESTRSMVARLTTSTQTLSDLCEIFVGVQTSADDVFHLDLLKETEERYHVLSRKDNREYKLEKGIVRPLISGTDVDRFQRKQIRQVIIFPYLWERSTRPSLYTEEIMKTKFPSAYGYLKNNESVLRAREGNKFDDKEWYRFGRSQNIGRQRGPKLCIPRLAQRIECCFDRDGAICLDNVDVMGIRFRDEKTSLVMYYALMAILNSDLVEFFIANSVTTNFRGGYSSFNKQFLDRIPIKLSKDGGIAERTAISAIQADAKELEHLQNALEQKDLSDNERARYLRNIDANAEHLNKLIWQLYGISDPFWRSESQVREIKKARPAKLSFDEDEAADAREQAAWTAESMRTLKEWMKENPF